MQQLLIFSKQFQRFKDFNDMHIEIHCTLYWGIYTFLHSQGTQKMYYYLISCTGYLGCTIYTFMYCTISTENNCFDAYLKNISSQWLYLCPRRCVVLQQDPGSSIISGLICYSCLAQGHGLSLPPYAYI